MKRRVIQFYTQLGNRGQRIALKFGYQMLGNYF